MTFFFPLIVKTLSFHYNFTVWMWHKQGSFQSSGSRNERGAGGQSLEGICKYKKDCTNLENCSTPTAEHLFTRVAVLKLLKLLT